MPADKEDMTLPDGKEHTIFPNPATDHFTLYASSLYNSELIIYNALGKMVYKRSGLYGNSVKIDKTNISNGLYLYEVLYADSTSYKGKLIFK